MIESGTRKSVGEVAKRIVDPETDSDLTPIAAQKRQISYFERFFPFILYLFHLAAALPLAFVLNIWTDEASTLYTTRAGFLQTFQNVFADEKQAPLYFLFLSLWREIDDSVFFARLPSIVFSLLAIKFFYDAARRFLDENAARCACFFFAVHPYLIWASTEIRVYSLVILLAAMLLYFFADGYANNSKIENAAEQRKARFWFPPVAVVALYANYYLGFLLVGGFVALLLTRRLRAARAYFLQMLLVGAAFAPLLWVFARQFADNADDFIETKSVGAGVGIVANQLLDLIFPMSLTFDAAPSAVSVVRLCFLALALAAIVFFIFKNKFRAIDEKVLQLAAFVLTVCAFLLTAYFALGSAYLAPRHFAVLFAPLFLLTCVLAKNALPPRVLIAVAVLFAVLFPYTKIYKQFPNLTKRGDWARVARYIEQNEKPNQPIVVFRNYDALALPVYYKGVNRILPNDKFFAWEQEAALDSENAFRRQTEHIISLIPPDAPEIWLAVEEICRADATRASCRPLENFVQANYTIVEAVEFYNENVYLLRKKPK